jgi:phenylalanyl-tRNA synthetase beta chain
MKISVAALKFINEHYHSADNPAPNGVDELVERLGAQLGAVEEVVDFGKRFDGVLVAKVASCQKHENSDHLNICKIDDGGTAQGVERDENGHIQVVCGAPNVREGLMVAWLPPGSTVPETYDKDPFVLGARELRGVMSNGMLASAKELSLGDSHDGILELDGDVAPGMYFADAYHLRDDAIIDIENKMFTHRPDCFGWLGVAREIEGISRRPYKSPEWYRQNPDIPGIEADQLPLEIRNELPEVVPRFSAIVLRDVTVKTSPVWLQIDLARAGMRPLNNIVDYTNFFMLETGQPLHAYDYDKVKALSGSGQATIVVRHPREGEKITLLSGKEVQPRSEAIMIATDQKSIGIGGVMGGGETEVDENTRNIIIECANFDMYSIRRTAMAHGLFTDAVTRFNKGQSPLQNPAVLGKIVDEIRRFADGKVASPLIDINHIAPEALQRGSVHPPVEVSARFINERLGSDLSAAEMRQILQNVEFDIEIQSENLTVKAPFWRTDIELPEDVVEEVGRLYGYDRLPLVLPKHDLTPAHKNDMLELKRKVRETLAKTGANEVLTYSFVHGNLLDKAGQNRDRAFRLGNALSPDLQYYRLSLTPSLLDKVHANIKQGFNEFALFEMGKVHNLEQTDEGELPKEINALSFVFASDGKIAKQKYAGAAYYEARKYLDNLLHHFNVAGHVSFEPLAGADLYGNPWVEELVALYEPNRSAVLRDAKGLVWGVIGEYKASSRKALKLPDFCAGFELDPLLFFQSLSSTRYTKLSRFPSVEQDICLRVAADMPFAKLETFVRKTLSEYVSNRMHWTLEPLDIYQREGDEGHKQITFRLTIADYEKTMRDTEVTEILNKVAEAAHQQYSAERV